jgi:hypothetical protein
MEEPENQSFDSRSERLRSTLIGRLNLLNIFMPLVSSRHVYSTIDNIGIDTNNEHEIVKYLDESNEYIDSFLLEYTEDWIVKYGSKWQKNRTLRCSKKQGEV